MRLVLLSCLVLVGCSKKDQSPPYRSPDLDLPNDAFDERYYPERWKELKSLGEQASSLRAKLFVGGVYKYNRETEDGVIELQDKQKSIQRELDFCRKTVKEGLQHDYDKRVTERSK